MGRKTRKQLRDERAELVCRELRSQLAERGCVHDIQKLAKLHSDWMRVTGKIKYKKVEVAHDIAQRRGVT